MREKAIGFNGPLKINFVVLDADVEGGLTMLVEHEELMREFLCTLPEHFGELLFYEGVHAVVSLDV